jgi:hypothetical protein
MQQSDKTSIHDLKPLEKGGTISRGGFVYQDHIAVSFLMEMISDISLEEVWCETHDDITLIRHGEIGQEVEFVQVKNISLDAFWSVAKLCKREKTNENQVGDGTSLLEKSFAQDRCAEPCKFRIVTSLPTSAPLKILTLPLTSPNRDISSDEFNKLIGNVQKKVNGLISPNNHDVIYWLKNTKWQVESEDEIITKNKAKLISHIMNKDIHLSSDVIETSIYPKILEKAQNSATIPWEVDDKAKKIRRKEFLDWLDNLLKDAQYPLSISAGEKLREKMEKAKIANDYILTAQDERRQFRRERLNPKYLDFTDLDLIEGEVLSELNGLRLRLDGDEFAEGAPFLKVCQDKLRDLQVALQAKAKPPLFYLDGCMYDITDRCAHRYHREAK